MPTYGLTWVDNDALYNVIEKTFSGLLGLHSSKRNELPPDPFLIVAQAVVLDTSFKNAMAFEDYRKINKSLSNALGNMHQDILGLAPNWEPLGTTGGVLDIKTKAGYIHPMVGKPIVAEIKNRFNTIKSSDEKILWDKIDEAARLNGAQGYLFQIVPKTPERYNCEWEPSGRKAKSTVKHCDGATAYELVFGYKDALYEFYSVLPKILNDIKIAHSLKHTAPLPTSTEMQALYKQVLPF